MLIEKKRAFDKHATPEKAENQKPSGRRRGEAKRGVRHFTARYLGELGLGIVALAVIVGAGVGVPAYGDALVVASDMTPMEQVSEQDLAPQAVEVHKKTPKQAVHRDTYGATEAPPEVVWPVGSGATITSGFGARAGCSVGCSTNHQGIDFTPGAGAPIVAAADGVVTAANTGGAYGVHVRIKSVVAGQEVETMYAHMQYGSMAVSVGQTVTAGQLIGAVGSTGVSTGPHLHFEVHVGGSPIEPLGWLRANSV